MMYRTCRSSGIYACCYWTFIDRKSFVVLLYNARVTYTNWHERYDWYRSPLHYTRLSSLRVVSNTDASTRSGLTAYQNQTDTVTYTTLLADQQHEESFGIKDRIKLSPFVFSSVCTCLFAVVDVRATEQLKFHTRDE